ncbi:ABC transporter permease subunit [Bacillus sp. BRMEA1]|uniref:ABC transporter permease subunit n=1 Tax=Neobacillus endophyticus TaxID=2738405 RepID=UPI0015650369|nr:ABC transporter permease subunit [Neobacillus endophyticus]NRD79994.1 ABC transporter permease subunit [Neobacillus endophyticus]
MKNLVRNVIRVIIVFAGFLFTFNLPYLFGIGKNNKFEINVIPFWQMVKANFLYLLQIKDPRYLGYFKQYSIMENYKYSMTLLLISLAAVILIAVSISISVMLAPKNMREHLIKGIHFFEAVPDLLVIFSIQFLVISFYKSTGFRIFQLYGFFGAKPYFIPIVAVSFLPIFLLSQFLIKVIMEEQSKVYVLYVKAKGMGRLRILFVHIFRNIFSLVLLQLRTVVWVILSNIYLLEYMFDINGFTRIFQKIVFIHADIASLVVCLLMFALPLVAVEAGAWLLSRRMKGKEAAGL